MWMMVLFCREGGLKKYVLFVIKGIFLCVMNVILVVIWLSVVLFSFLFGFLCFFFGGEVVFYLYLLICVYFYGVFWCFLCLF